MSNTGKFKATVFWNEMLQFVFSHTEHHSKKVKKKQHEFCLCGTEIVSLIHIFLQRHNGINIDVAELTRENADKVFKKMLGMNTLIPLISQKCDESSYFLLNKSCSKYKICCQNPKQCLNPRLPDCTTGYNMQAFCQPGVKSKPLLSKSMLENNQEANDPIINDLFGTAVGKKRNNHLTNDDFGTTLPKVKCIRRRSYNLANRHSEIFSPESHPLLNTQVFDSKDVQVSLARLLYEVDIPVLEDILDAICFEVADISSEFAFENKMFEESKSSFSSQEQFINSALACLSVVPDNFSNAKTMLHKKLICFQTVKSFYRYKSLIPTKLHILFQNVVISVLNESKTKSKITQVQICQLFLFVLPPNMKKDLLALLNLIKSGSEDRYVFNEMESNENFFYKYFSPAICRISSISPEELTMFTKFLVSKLSKISSPPSHDIISLPLLNRFIDLSTLNAQSSKTTNTEIKLLISYIIEIPFMSDGKKKMLIKKLKKHHNL